MKTANDPSDDRKNNGTDRFDAKPLKWREQYNPECTVRVQIFMCVCIIFKNK